MKSTELTRIDRIVFRHGEDDYGLWQGLQLSEEDENIIQSILLKYDTQGDSIRGTWEDIVKEMSEAVSSKENKPADNGQLERCQKIGYLKEVLDAKTRLTIYDEDNDVVFDGYTYQLYDNKALDEHILTYIKFVGIGKHVICAIEKQC